MRLLLALLTLGLAATARAESYRILHLLVKQDVIRAADKDPSQSFNNAFKDEAKFGAAVDSGVIIIQNIAAVKLAASGIGVLEQTYPLTYPQRYDAAGNPLDPTTRKVGLSVRLQKQANHSLLLNYTATELTRWLVYGPEKRFLQPAFVSNDFNTSLTVNEGDAYTIIGGHGDKDNPMGELYVIQRIPDSAVWPQ